MHIGEIDFQVRDEVLVSTRNIRTTRASKKLESNYMGPYYIKRKISPVAFEPQLPKSMKIHPVFHVDLLKPYVRSTDTSRSSPKPPPISVEEQKGWIIKDIIDVRKKGKHYEYLIDWVGFPPESRTWEPRWHLDDDELLKTWHSSHPEKI
ncbi:hypothetical protein SeLEV6574_g07822 [Synchytrium endobioticum]|uniref:Chromo domain-containing protein n=1 Tax=Synchytrium endobioticum TaxID=286115 RepID=A0A507CEY6_9FUNG|nr:hypothetical protein SeLEV6574_g07822 [Synchytrium endobioticum]